MHFIIFFHYGISLETNRQPTGRSSTSLVDSELNDRKDPTAPPSGDLMTYIGKVLAITAVSVAVIGIIILVVRKKKLHLSNCRKTAPKPWFENPKI